jgi:hypothetical protein
MLSYNVHIQTIKRCEMEMKDYHDGWNIYLNEEETVVYNEILKWEEQPGKTHERIAYLTIPLLEKMKSIPSNVTDAVTDTIREILKVLRDYSSNTINRNLILERLSRKESREIGDILDIKGIPISSLDAVAKECLNFNALAATVEGGLTGTLGLNGMILDLPLLYGFLFRTIQEASLCYGYSLDSPEEKLHILKILELAHTTGNEPRKNALDELRALQLSIRGGITINRIEGMAASKSLEKIAEKIGGILLRRKLALALLIIGGISGATLNYLFARQVGDTAFYSYRKRFLMDRAEERRTG